MAPTDDLIRFWRSRLQKAIQVAKASTAKASTSMLVKVHRVVSLLDTYPQPTCQQILHKLVSYSLTSLCPGPTHGKYCTM